MRSIVQGPSPVTALCWRDEVESTNDVLAAAARQGEPEVAVVGADVQTAGRGRRGRRWQAPPGTSLQVSFLFRPRVPARALTLLPLVAGVALAEVVSAHVGAQALLKWPNDVLLGDHKAAGILAERVDGAVVLGMGVNVDWRGVDRPDDLAGATSLAEAAGGGVDRWRVLAGLVGVLGRRYTAWQQRPDDVLIDYRARCATLGRQVAVARPDGTTVRGQAADIAADGALEVLVATGRVHVHAGDVLHVRSP